MKDYKTESIRNVCLGAHSGAGKTSLVEALVYDMGVTNRIGTIENGTTVSDYNEDEIERQISISSALLHGEWNNCKINLIDTPGYSDFFGEVVGALNAADSVMVVVSATSGVEVGTELVWNKAEELGLPRFIVVNKLDRENVNFDDVVGSIHETFGRKVQLTQFPVNAGPGFNGIIDLIKKKYLKFSTDGSGKYTEEAIPADFDRISLSPYSLFLAGRGGATGKEVGIIYCGETREGYKFEDCIREGGLGLWIGLAGPALKRAREACHEIAQYFSEKGIPITSYDIRKAPFTHHDLVSVTS